MMEAGFVDCGVMLPWADNDDSVENVGDKR